MNVGKSLRSIRLGAKVMHWLLGGSVAISVQALDWPNYRGPHHDGISRETGWTAAWPADGPKVLWRARVGIGFSSFAVADGRVYTMGNTGKGSSQDRVFCFDAASGDELWRHSYDEDLRDKYYEGGPSATPTVAGGRVYTLSKTGKLLCFAAADGTLLWERSVPQVVAAEAGREAKIPTWGFAGSVLVMDDRLYLNVGTYGSALDLTGNLVWTTGAKPAGYSSYVPFTLDGRKQLAVFGAKAVAGVDPSDGEVLWTHPWKTSYDVNSADPIVSGHDVFISSGYGKGAALVRIDNGRPRQVWFGKSIMRNQHNTCVLIDGFLYGFDGDNDSDLKCIEFKTGNEQWAEHGLGKGALIGADGKLIINSEQGELVIAAADPAGFNALARAQVVGGKCWTAPALANGRIYLRNEKGDVACVDVRRSNP